MTLYSTKVYTVTIVKASHKDSFQEVDRTKVFTDEHRAGKYYIDLISQGSSVISSFDGVITKSTTIKDAHYFTYTIHMTEHPILVDIDEIIAKEEEVSKQWESQF